MTGVDKILVIVVLVFSVVFVVAAISGYTSTRDKINVLDKQVTDSKALAQNKDKEAANWKGLYDDLKATADQKDLTIQTGDKALAEAQITIAELKKEGVVNNDIVTKLQGTISELSNTVIVLQQKVEELTKTFQSTKDELAAAKDKVRDLGKQVFDLNSQAAADKDQADKYKAEIARLNKIINNNNAPSGTENNAQPGTSVDCQVLEVKRDGGTVLVALNKGTEAGLAVNTKLYVWNSTDGYKGKITIVEVNDKGAFGRVDWEVDNKKIVAGDTATVQTF